MRPRWTVMGVGNGICWSDSTHGWQLFVVIPTHRMSYGAHRFESVSFDHHLLYDNSFLKQGSHLSKRRHCLSMKDQENEAGCSALGIGGYSSWPPGES